MTVWRMLVTIAAGAAAGYLFWPAVDRPGEKRSLTCFSNVKQLGLALVLYANDHDDRFPDRDQWMDAAGEYAKGPQIFHCPEVAKRDAWNRFGYSFDAALSRQQTFKFDEQAAPLVYDSVNEARNASDRFNSLPKPGRHDGANNIVFTDAHARRMIPNGPKD